MLGDRRKRIDPLVVSVGLIVEGNSTASSLDPKLSQNVESEISIHDKESIFAGIQRFASDRTKRISRQRSLLHD